MDIKKQLLMEDIRDKMKKFRGKVIIVEADSIHDTKSVEILDVRTVC